MNAYENLIPINENIRSITLADILSDDQLQILSELGGSKTHKKAPAVRREDLEFVLPLEPRHNKSSVKGIQVKLRYSGDEKKAWESLLWHAIYSSSEFRIFTWYILYNVFIRRLKYESFALSLLRILRLTTQRCGKAYNQKLRSVRQIISFYDKELALKYCKHLEHQLGIKLPTSVPPLTEFFHLKEIKIKQRKPPEPRRIGVGYKDKGHLPDESHPKVDPFPDESYLEPTRDLFVELMSQSKECEAFVEDYDPKKREKILSKLKNHFKDE
jgi:hypothetical protein